MELELEQWQHEQQQSQQQQLCLSFLRTFGYNYEWRMVLFEDMLDAYYDCRKSKRKKDSSLLFELNFEANCLQLTEEINNRTYRIGRSITFIVTRPKLREVFAADFRDRVVHHWLMRKLEPLFESTFIEDTYNCRKGKGTQYGVFRLADKMKKISNNYTEDCWVSKFDMSGFFMSIRKQLLWRKLELFITDKYKESDIDDILWVTKKIVLNCPQNNCIRKTAKSTWNGLEKNKSLFTCGDGLGLPIGNLTSLIFANYYLHDFDTFMVELFGEGYGRYVDDFFVITNDKFKLLQNINSIKDKLNEIGVVLHPNKMYILYYTNGIKFTGGVIKPNRVYTANRTIHNFKGLIDYLNRSYAEDTESIMARLNSYLGFLRHTSSYSIRRRLLCSIGVEWSFKFYIRNDYKVVAAYDAEKIRWLIKHKVVITAIAVVE